MKQTTSWINKRIAKAGTIDAKKYGKPKTDEEKRHLSENSPKYWKNKNRSEETKKKISKTRLKNGMSEKTKEAICKMVIKYNPLNNETIAIYDSTADASRFNVESQSTISRRCCDKNKNNGDYFFKFL